MEYLTIRDMYKLEGILTRRILELDKDLQRLGSGEYADIVAGWLGEARELKNKLVKERTLTMHRQNLLP